MNTNRQAGRPDRGGNPPPLKIQYSNQELRDRGWVDPLIGQFLGQPDEIRRGLDYYDADRVDALESSPEFQAARDRAELAEISITISRATQQADLRNQIENLVFTVEKMDRATLYERARRSYNRQHPEEIPATPKSNSRLQERLAVNYLRHYCTDYEHTLEKIRHKLDWQDAPLIVKEKALTAIALAYPELAEEVRFQTQRARQVHVEKRLNLPGRRNHP